MFVVYESPSQCYSVIAARMDSSNNITNVVGIVLVDIVKVKKNREKGVWLMKWGICKKSMAENVSGKQVKREWPRTWKSQIP